MKINRRILFVILTGLWISACTIGPPGLMDSSLPPTETPNWPTSVPRTPTAAVKTILTPDALSDRLNAQGPWLLLSTDKGLWAANPNGSGLKQLLDNNLPSTKLQDALQPGGSQLAVISSDNGTYHHMILNLLSLPDGKMTPITALTSDQTEKAADGVPGDPGFESLRAIGEQRSLAWSPDGQKLAFIGLMDGPSADLYVYSRNSGKIQRMSKGKSEDYAPSWAPDGRHILFFSADSFGTGAGFSMTGVWSAAADGTGINLLYQPKSSSETVHGWVDRNTVAISSWGAICGNAQLRLYNIANDENRIVQKDCFSDAAVSPQGDVFYGSEKGLFIYPKGAKQGKQITQGSVTQLLWDANSRLFIVRFEDGRLISMDSDGNHTEVSPVKSMNGVASNGTDWAWTSSDTQRPGVWISRPGQPAQQIYFSKASFPTWDANNYLLFFFKDKIYSVKFPDYSKVSPAATLNASVQEMLWVAP